MCTLYNVAAERGKDICRKGDEMLVKVIGVATGLTGSPFQRNHRSPGTTLA